MQTFADDVEFFGESPDASELYPSEDDIKDSDAYSSVAVVVSGRWLEVEEWEEDWDAEDNWGASFGFVGEDDFFFSGLLFVTVITVSK